MKTMNSGWKAQLELEFSKLDNRSFLSHRRHFGPLQVQKPFYPELNGACHVYILHPPGGMVGGDSINIDINANANSHALITTPAAGKFYRSSGATARQNQTIRVLSGGILEWLPSENILFSGANVQVKTKVELAKNSQFTGWEILCLGRPASGEIFSQGELEQRFEVWRDGRPLRIERLRLRGEDPILKAKWGMLGFPVIGSMICVTYKKGLVDSLRGIYNLSTDQEFFSATQTEDAILCYFLGNSAEGARKHFVSAWKILRHEVIGYEAVQPRVWRT